MTDALALDEKGLAAIAAKAEAAIDAAPDARALDETRVQFLGKKGQVSLLMRELGRMDADARKEAGAKLNALRDALAERIAQRKTALEDAELEARLATERVDASLPVRPETRGVIHPVSQVQDELLNVFAEMGFSIAEGPDIDDDWHNFTALNFPPDHPARDVHDTFFLEATDKDGKPLVLRTHTSTVQIRTMMAEEPPLRVIAPGRVYRCDWDATHTPMFHQIEGLVIDRETHMGHLKGCLMEFVEAYFELEGVEARFRPHHFPFTEPSAEMDVRCDRSGDQVKIGQGDDWLEILGCGMVHPNVLKNCGYDPAVYQGFAFGMGVDRVAMLKYGMPDLRPFFESDVRWLSHYGFAPTLTPNLATGLS